MDRRHLAVKHRKPYTVDGVGPRPVRPRAATNQNRPVKQRPTPVQASIRPPKRPRRTMRYKRLMVSVLSIAVSAVLILHGSSVLAFLGLGGPGSDSIDLNKGLIGWWKMNGNALDSAGTNNGTVTSATLTSDRKSQANSAYDFNGTSARITEGLSLPRTQGTISHWLKPDQIRQMVAYYESDGTDSDHDGFGSGGAALEIHTSILAGFWSFGYQDGSSAMLIAGSTTTTPAVGQWALVTVTWNRSGNILFYVNGNLEGTTSMTGTTFGNRTATVHQMGRVGNGSATRYWDGAMDDVRVYDRAVSAAEVKALYDSYSPTQVQLATTQKGLIGRWDMNGDLKDSSPYGKHGSGSGVSLTTDRKSQSNMAYSFNGTSSFITVNSPGLPTGNFTYAAWIKLNSVADSTLFYAGDGLSGNRDEFLLQIISGQLRLVLDRGTPIVGGAGSITANTWVHVAVTRSGATNTFYVNGTSDGTGVDGSALDFNTCQLLIGVDADTGNCNGTRNEFFDGVMDDARIYNRALSQAEIQQLIEGYNGGVQLSSLSKGLVGYWPLNGNAKDLTPNSNHGTVSASFTSLAADRKSQTNSSYDFTGGGTAQGISIPSNAAYNSGTITVSAWVWTDSTDVTRSAVARYNNTTPTSGNWILGNGGAASEFRWVVRLGTTNVLVSSPTNFSTGAWHHLVGVYDGTNAILYVDGQQTGSVGSAGSLASNSTTVSIGTRPNNSSTAVLWDGKVDDVRIYNRPLSQAEITMLYEGYR